MAANLFKLVGSIYIDTDKANESLQKTDEKAEKTSVKFSKMGKAALAIGTAAATGTAAAIKGMKDLADSSAAAADEIDKGSIRMGVSTEEFQKLKYAAGQSGVELSTLETAAKSLQKSGSDLDLTSALMQVASITDESERSAAAMDLFGAKAGYQLAPLLAEGSAGIQDLTDRASQLGLVMSEDAVNAGVVFGDTMSDLEQSVGAAKNMLGAEFIPVFQTIADLIIENMPTIQEMVHQLAPLLADMLVNLVPLVEQIFPLIVELLPVIVDLAKTVIPPVLEIAQTVIPYLIEVIQTFIPVVQNVIDFITNVFSGNWQEAWSNVVEIFRGIWETMKSIFTAPINWIIDKLNNFIDYVNKIQIPDWVPDVGGKGLNFSHIPKLAVGIDYVPSDNYPALLHRGEQVLTAKEALAYRNGGSGNEMSKLIALNRELISMLRNGTAKTSATISNTRELRNLYGT